MKNILSLTLVIVLLAACKDTPKSNSNKSKIMEGVMNEITGKNEEINKKYDLLLKELGAKTPLTNNQLIAAFPKKLNHLNLDPSEQNTKEPEITDTQLVAGSFGDDTIRMEILDAAGQKAVGAILPLKMLHLNKITSESNNTIRYSKIERNGILTFGTDRDANTKADFQSELRFLYGNRFYVTLVGKGMDTDALWKAMGIDNLNGFRN
ncbi:hypothetical protein HZY62_13395 [Maribacter polysiphoniae]|uniref:Uncharacterized protein n=1 Tax=Maribacter polysiphoniae TaxID=429344 RepID=A0A316DXU5_9FLAO|nr:hypothetical protein [Maribacter polysiphoniae]MBD1261593.1 hypothetical protein [Maribacter polysiphoniae]PWK22931.1 hypothetical protein LX92_02870 [Maribacter polysiphoniae]